MATAPNLSESESYAARDEAHVLHPFTSFAADAPPVVLERNEGARLVDTEGRSYLDAIAGLMNVNIGYGNRKMAEAAYQAMADLSYASVFFNMSHKPAIDLATRLAELTPGDIERFLFTVGGSDAIESAIKVARLYHRLRGAEGRDKILGRRKSYHGMSYGALSATGQEVYRDGYGPVVPGFVHVGQPSETGPDELEEAILREGPQTIAAMIAEPISAPSVVEIPPPDYWPRVREILRRHGILLVSDEVITGFGRTGKLFACEHWNLEPDMMTMSKGLTSGYQPLGALGISAEISATLRGAEGVFLHGFTAGGHPVACAVANANLDVILGEGLVENAARLGEYFLPQLAALRERHPSIIARERALGLFAAIDFSVDDEVCLALAREAQDRGLLVRHYGTTFAFAPPLTIGEEEIDEIVTILGDAIKSVC